MPATIPAAIKSSEIIDHMTPQHWLDPPYLFANTLASELFTFRRIKSSHYFPSCQHFSPLTTASSSGNYSQYPKHCTANS